MSMIRLKDADKKNPRLSYNTKVWNKEYRKKLNSLESPVIRKMPSQNY